jgi:hypothetical protein
MKLVMKLGLGLRVAVAVAALFAQLALPIAHGGNAGAESSARSAGAVIAATCASSAPLAHDSRACPICTALCQARAGIGRSVPTASLLIAIAFAQPIERAQTLAGILDLDTAPPRAPPVLSLAFA